MWKPQRKDSPTLFISSLHRRPEPQGWDCLVARDFFFFNQIEASTEAWMVGFSQGEAKQLLGRKYSK